ncbi:hypothetical protein [Roseibium album]|uniref:hypothetical protein n=1 Tax=Roseibium album TaxID=311410 RepID=UPI002492CC1B|nr:hypothetical protein [Roseibium album]
MTAHAGENAVVTKGEFAKYINVTPGRVSQYIAEGKIYGDALVGTGRGARINRPIAQEQLRLVLHIGQMIGNGLETNLTGSRQPAEPTFDQVPPQSEESKPELPDPRVPTIEDKLKRERLFQEQIRSRKAAADEEASQGRFTLTEEVKAGNTRIAVKMIQTFEGALPTMAAKIASKFELPVRDVLHELRSEFAEMRSRAIKKSQAEADRLTATVETEIGVTMKEAAE